MIPYYYNKQLKKYLIQFMNIFSGIQVEVGSNSSGKAERHLIEVPIHFSQMDKVAANIAAGGTVNKPVRVPVMSCDITAIRTDPLANAGLNQTFSQTYLPQGEYFANGVKTLVRLRPAVYVMDIDLAIWTSNTDQHFQILEQLLPIFNPSVQIQTSDAQFDWGKITMVTLENMAFNNNYPIGTANRVIMTNMQFSMPVYLSAPADIQDTFVRDIKLRLSAMTDQEFDSMLQDGMLDEFDNSMAEYQTIASVDTIVANAATITPPSI